MSEAIKWRRRKEARPHEIIDAALELFVQQGFSATKLADVAKRAKISKGTLYLYFESKEALFRAVVQQIIVPVVEKAEGFVREYAGSQKELICILVRNWWRTVGEKKIAAMPKLMVSEAHHFPELAEFYVNNVVKRTRDLFASVIRRGIECGEFKQCDINVTVRLLVAPVVFALIWEKSLAIYDHDDFDREIYLQTHLDMFLAGISK